MFRKSVFIIAVIVVASIGTSQYVWPDKIAAPWSAPTSCDYDGRSYKVGDSRSAGDTCNACVCGASGWMCTQNTCPKSDGKDPGVFRGALTFPSEFLPAMRVCAERYLTNERFCTQTNDGDVSYELRVPSGAYWISAERLGEATGPIAHHSEASVCGLGPECPNHSPVLISVEAGETVMADPSDWYAPASILKISVTPSKRIDAGQYYLENASISIEARGASSIEVAYVPYYTWLTERSDMESMPFGAAELVSTDEAGRQLWKIPIQEGFDAGRLWAVATGEDGAVFRAPGIGWVRSDDVNWPGGKSPLFPPDSP